MAEYHGIWRNITEYGGISRNMAEYHGIWRNITEYHAIFPEYTGTSQYFPMVAMRLFIMHLSMLTPRGGGGSGKGWGFDQSGGPMGRDLD